MDIKVNREWRMVNSVPVIVTKVALKKAGEEKEMKEVLLCDTLTRKVHLAGTWMSEKSFASPPYSCHDKMLDLHILMPRSVENVIMAS